MPSFPASDDMADEWLNESQGARRGRLLWLQAAEMFVEPVGQERGVFAHVGPAVGLAFFHDEPGFRSGVLRLFHESFGLLHGHQLVGVPVDDEGGREIRGDEADRGNLPAVLLPLAKGSCLWNGLAIPRPPASFARCAVSAGLHCGLLKLIHASRPSQMAA